MVLCLTETLKCEAKVKTLFFVFKNTKIEFFFPLSDGFYNKNIQKYFL